MAAVSTTKKGFHSLFATLRYKNPSFTTIVQKLGINKSALPRQPHTEKISLTTAQIGRLFRFMEQDFTVFASAVIGLDYSLLDSKQSTYLASEPIKRLCITVAPGYKNPRGLKSLLSAYLLWKIAKDHNIRILLVSKNLKSAKTLMPTIKLHIQKNQKYREWARVIDPQQKGVFPKIGMIKKRLEQWSAAAITVGRTNLSTKDSTVAAEGRRGSILGRRADIIVVSDLTDERKAKKKKAREKVSDWFYTTLMPVLAPHGKIICIGTVLHKNDFISTISRDTVFETIRLS